MLLLLFGYLKIF